MQLVENKLAAPPPLPKARRPRIKEAGTAILQEFLTNHPSTFPSVAQRRELLERIHGIPGCEDYSLVRLNGWFQRRRKSSGTAESNANHHSNIQETYRETTGTSPYPSLTDRSIQKLTILSQGNLAPSHEVVQTWAELLEARAEDVVAWLLDQHHETNGGQSWLPHHLPTPTSTSPEPFGEYQESLKVESPYSPILPSSLSRTHQPALDLLSPNFLLKAIVDATETQAMSTKPPYNANEFEERFQPYMKKMKAIIQTFGQTNQHSPT